jgi:hypothetical protein
MRQVAQLLLKWLAGEKLENDSDRINRTGSGGRGWFFERGWL